MGACGRGYSRAFSEEQSPSRIISAILQKERHASKDEISTESAPHQGLLVLLVVAMEAAGR